MGSIASVHQGISSQGQPKHYTAEPGLKPGEGLPLGDGVVREVEDARLTNNYRVKLSNGRGGGAPGDDLNPA